MVSNVDEETDFFNAMPPQDMVIALAITKAHTIREQIDFPAIIIGCDSTFEFEGQSLGKPGVAHVAKERAQRVRGKSGYLHTGHCVIDTSQGREISINSGEPLHVAGGFTLDGFSSPFIPSIEGDYTNVVGISMPFLRSAMNQLGYSWPEVKLMK